MPSHTDSNAYSKGRWRGKESQSRVMGIHGVGDGIGAFSSPAFFISTARFVGIVVGLSN